MPTSPKQALLIPWALLIHLGNRHLESTLARSWGMGAPWVPCSICVEELRAQRCASFCQWGGPCQSSETFLNAVREEGGGCTAAKDFEGREKTNMDKSMHKLGEKMNYWRRKWIQFKFLQKTVKKTVLIDLGCGLKPSAGLVQRRQV